MKFVTFNIRLDNHQDGIYNFDCRKEPILRKLRDEKPDILCFQEVLPHVLTWLRENLPEYYVVGCGRGPEFDDEASAIACRKDTVELMGFETFWLSPTPHLPGSRYAAQSPCPRICSVATLRPLGRTWPMRVYNTHLDHEGARARLLGLTRILKKMEADRTQLPMPALLAGDFNACPGSPELAPLDQFPVLSLRDVTASIPVTYHGYGREQVACKIDYIFATPDFTAKNVCCWIDRPQGIYLSDHYPVCVELEI